MFLLLFIFCTNRYSLGNIFCESYLWVAQVFLIFGGLLFSIYKATLEWARVGSSCLLLGAIYHKGNQCFTSKKEHLFVVITAMGLGKLFKIKQYSWFSVFPQNQELFLIRYSSSNTGRGLTLTISVISSELDFRFSHLVHDFMENLERLLLLGLILRVVWILLVSSPGVGETLVIKTCIPLGQLSYTEYIYWE